MVSSNLNIAVQMDPLAEINFASDSTWQILLEAKNYGRIFYYLPENLSYIDEKVMASAQELLINQDETYALGDPNFLDLASMDVILIRQDPPYNMQYLTCCYILEKIADEVLFVNHPRALRSFPEKISPLAYKNLIPKTIITGEFEVAKTFAKKYSKIILKPLYGFAGEDVYAFEHSDEAFAQTFHKMLNLHQTALIIQEFIPNVSKGDKRIILIDGEAEGCFIRVPDTNSIRANLAQGGEAKPSLLSDRDKEICQTLKAFLKDNGLFFVGIDVIDGYLTEINITSPTGLQQIKEFDNSEIVKIFWQKILEKLRNK